MLPNSSSRPTGHHPPQSIPCLSATSSAARSTPVCPPEMILSAFTVAAVSDRRPRNRSSVAGWKNISALDHEDHRSFGRACTMAHSFGHYESLARRKIDYAIFEIDQKPPIE